MESLKWMHALPQWVYSGLEVIANMIGIVTVLMAVVLIFKILAERNPLVLPNTEKGLENLKGQYARRFSGYKEWVGLLVLMGVLGTVAGVVPFVKALDASMKKAAMTLSLSALSAAFLTSFIGISLAIVATILMTWRKNRLFDPIDAELIRIDQATSHNLSESEKLLAKEIGEAVGNVLATNAMGRLIEKTVQAQVDLRVQQRLAPGQTQSLGGGQNASS